LFKMLDVAIVCATCLATRATINVPKHFKGVEEGVVFACRAALVDKRLLLGNDVAVKKPVVCLVHEVNQFFREEAERVPFKRGRTCFPVLLEFVLRHLEGQGNLEEPLNEVFGD